MSDKNINKKPKLSGYQYRKKRNEAVKNVPKIQSFFGKNGLFDVSFDLCRSFVLISFRFEIDLFVFLFS